MPLLRTPTGEIVSIPANEAGTAEAGGYTPVDIAQAGEIAAAPASEDRGVLGGINAAATGFLSGATLGGSDYLLKGILDKGQFERLGQEREGHAIAGGLGQVAGAVLPAIAAPGSLLGSAPAGILGHAAAGAVAEGRAIGGAAGLARSLAASGVEGAIQNAGMYLSDTALGDRELSAEGLAGALGPGFAFGVGGGAAALGLEQGTIAARRLFSRAAGTSKAAEAAEGAWTTQYQSALEANDAAADIAKAKLAEARAAREQAQLAKQQAQADLAARKVQPPDVPRSQVPGASAVAPPVPQPVEVAGLLHDRAMAAMDPAQLAAWDAANGPRLAELMRGTGTSPIVLEEAAQVAPQAAKPPGGIDWDALEQSAAMPPEQLAAQQQSILSKAAEEELAAAVAEHEGARIDFEDMLRRLEAPAIEPGVASRAVPVDEFGAPGQRGAMGTPGPHEPAQVSVTDEVTPPPFASNDMTRQMRPGEVDLNFDAKKRLYYYKDPGKVAAEEAARFAPPEDVTGMRVRPELPTPTAKREPVQYDKHFAFDEESEVGKALPALPDGDRYKSLTYDEYDAMKKDLRSAMSKDEVNAARAYAGTADFRQINSQLRSDGVYAPDRVDKIDHLLSTKGLSKEPLRVYRGLGFDSGTEEARKLWEGISPGDTIIDKAYNSTSASFEYAHGFGKVTLAIDVPAGYPAAAIPSGASEQTEILLRRGTKYKVIGVHDAGDGRIVAHLRVEPSELPAIRRLGKGETVPKATSPIEVIKGGAPATDTLTGQAAPSAPLEIRVTREGRHGRNFHASMPDGTVKTLADRGDVEPLIEAQLPPGFRMGNRFIDSTQDAAVVHGLPADSAGVRSNSLYVARPSELADRGIIGGDLHQERLTSIGAARGEKLKLDPIEIQINKEGKIFLDDGNHRLQHAAKTDSPVAIKFIPVDEFRGFGGSFDIAGRIRKELPVAPASLTGQMRSMQERLAGGESLNELGAPSRAEYAAAKAEKTAAASEHFRGKANAENYAGSQMGETERDAFFSNMTRPKTRDAYVAANIGKAMREEGSHTKALARVEREWAERGGAPSGRMSPVVEPVGHPLVPAQLEAAHEAAVQRAAAAQSPREQLTAEREIRAIERQMTAVGKRPGAVEDIAAVAESVTKYEKSSARLAEALGPDAPPAAQDAAKAFREAESHSERKAMERTTRAIDDHAEAQAKPDWLDEAKRMGGKARMTAAEQRDLDAVRRKLGMGLAKEDVQRTGAEFAKARAAETKAAIGARNAEGVATKARTEAEAARPMAPAEGQTSTLGAIATTVGIAGELGVPGLPKPHEIPIIGPLLGALLAYKALKASAGRFVGRIPATGDARAAALVAKTKDRIAKAVDRTLGLAEAAAAKSRVPLVAAATTLGHRAFDDGEPDAPKGANTQQLAAVRIREIANAATRPDLVTALVRKELRGVTDPDLITAAEKHLMARYEYLNSVMPKQPAPNPYTKREWLPSPGQANEVAQRLSVVHDPESAFIDTTPAKADTLRNVSPRLLQFAQQRLIERVSDTTAPVPYQQRLKSSLLFGVQLDDSLDPQAIATFQSAHAANRASATPQPATPPASSIAADTNLNSMYQTSADRRASR